MTLDSRSWSTARLWRYLLVILILLVALFFRLHNLDLVPPGLDGDEMFNGWDARRVWEGNLMVYFPANYGREPLLIYLIALITRLLGTSAWTIRLASALCGVVGLTVTWAFARRLFNFRVAILATALMSVSLWPIFLSRVALRAGLQPTCQVVAVYAFWRALQGRSGRWAIVAGLFIGLTFYTYTAGRIFPLVLVFWGGIVFVSERRMLRGNGRRVMLTVLVAGLVLLPLVAFALKYPETFNQRVSDLNFELNRLRAGDTEPILRSFRATVRMFTWEGERNWRYNPSKRPVFDWATGMLFYLGLIVSVFRLGKPAYSLLLAWLPIMLVPSMLSIGTPSFLRSAGALTPIFLLPAIGGDFVWERIVCYASRVVRRGSQVAYWALCVASVVGLTFVAIDTWHDYFVEWVSHPQVLHTYEADLAAAARYLDERVSDDTPVWISSDYPADLSRRLLGLQSTYAGPIRWFDGRQATVWPSGWVAQDVLIIYTKSAPPNPDARSALSGYLTERQKNATGQVHLWVYRIPGDHLDEPPWQPAHSLDGRFARDREVVGYDLPTRVERQTEVPVVVYWRVPSGVAYDMSDLPRSYVCIQDRDAGRCTEDVPAHYNVYPLWDWSVGDVVAQRYEVPVPAHLPPQTTYFHVGMFNSVGEISFADEEGAGAPLLIGPVEVVGKATVEPQWDADTPTFNQELALLNSCMLPQRSPGSLLEVEMLWQAMRVPSRDYALRLVLREWSTGKVVASSEEILGPEGHLSSRWLEGEPVRVFHQIRIPSDLSGGEYGVYVVLLEMASRQAVGSSLCLGQVSVSGRPHSFELPDPEYPLTADFGSIIRFLGFDLREVNPTGGGQIKVVLYWQALDAIERDYKVFVHLYHPFIEGGLPGQHDSPPGNGAFPTSSWLPGEVVTDPHLVSIEPNADAGTSEMGVGLYLPSTGERLPVFVDGLPQPDDVLIITEVEIE